MIAPGKLQELPPRAKLLIAATAAIALAGAIWAWKSTHAGGGGPGHPGGGAGAEATQLVRRGGAIFVPEGSPYRARISVASVQQKNISRSKVVTGTVEADPTRTVKILAPVAGRVGALDVSLGDTVKKGQRLATIDSGDLAQAVADAEKARATVKLTKSALERATGLNKAGGLALRELEQAQNDYRQATTELKRAEARLEVIGDSGTVSGQRQIALTSPIDGTITALETAPGDFIDNATESMMTISNLEKVWVTASVQEKDLSFVQKDERVEVTLLAYPGEVFSGRVQVISQLLEADTRRNKVRISFDNPYGIFKLNMFASVRFFAPAAQSILVPSSALFIVNDTTSVFVETGPWTFQRKPVVIEADYEGSTIVRGLEPGQRIVVRGGVLLND
ncbi:efflux RND transporter periplasmic adaptor subunit [Methylocystis parvus]|uniref:Efflux RND transporter periplasmic adaptor subunit n=1 Tax=Methylocystis parvus TaxID=134 RepID=A0A6B8M4P1_9HYPH|nr:efflux RND transporter periplasmic adaptor subunit [Methylocystis parvus]QGM97338.1 efflux RND transporter periplasmic adaptor subunit [Methylocystis parvus]WBJ98751.1 efflux RND transporter periplasmic adaptor subunit [Methylocystis parvus OBBP]